LIFQEYPTINLIASYTVPTTTVKLDISSSANSNLYEIDLPTINGFLKFVLDTGADVSAIDNQARLNHPYLSTLPLTSTDQKVTAADNTYLKIIGTIEIEFKLNNTSVKFAVLILEKLIQNFILGLDFIRRFTSTIDLKNKAFTMEIPTTERGTFSTIQLLKLLPQEQEIEQKAIKGQSTESYRLPPKAFSTLKLQVPMIKQSTIYRTETAETFQNKYPTLKIIHSTFYLEEN
jgi:hypothetical protein